MRQRCYCEKIICNIFQHFVKEDIVVLLGTSICSSLFYVGENKFQPYMEFINSCNSCVCVRVPCQYASEGAKLTRCETNIIKRWYLDLCFGHLKYSASYICTKIIGCCTIHVQEVMHGCVRCVSCNSISCSAWLGGCSFSVGNFVLMEVFN